MTMSMTGYIEASFTGTYEASGDEGSAKFTSIDEYKLYGEDVLASLSSAEKAAYLADCSIECTYELKKDILTLTDKKTSEKLVLTKVKK